MRLVRLAVSLALIPVGLLLFWVGLDFLGTLWGWNYRDNSNDIYILWGGGQMVAGALCTATGVWLFRSQPRPDGGGHR